MDYLAYGILGVLFLINTVVQYRLGFGLGSKAGYTIGMLHAAFWLRKNNLMSEENTQSPTDLVIRMFRSESLKDLNDLVQIGDLERIAKEAEKKN